MKTEPQIFEYNGSAVEWRFIEKNTHSLPNVRTFPMELVERFLYDGQMAIPTERISDSQADTITHVEEGQFSDVKAKEIAPSKLTKTISAFANSDGGDIYIGISEIGAEKKRQWEGFANQEAANGHIQCFEALFPLGTDFQYEFLKCNDRNGLILHVQVQKTQGIVKASSNIVYLRRGAQSLPVDTPDALKRLEYSKGIAKFEEETTTAPKETITTSEVIASFVRNVVPTSTPEDWLKKQVMLRNDKPTVAGV